MTIRKLKVSSMASCRFILFVRIIIIYKSVRNRGIQWNYYFNIIV